MSILKARQDDRMRTMIEKMRGLREDNDLTQRQLADVLGTSQTMYARYERGANEVPLRHVVTLCKFYNVRDRRRAVSCCGNTCRRFFFPWLCRGIVTARHHTAARTPVSEFHEWGECLNG